MHTVLHGEPEALSVADVARVSGLGRTFVYSALADGTLRARKAGRRTIVMRADLRAFLDGLPAYKSEASSPRAV